MTKPICKASRGFRRKPPKREPTPTIMDPRQLDLVDYIKRQAFATLDAEIARVLSDSGNKYGGKS
jgi:hypothetical protein